MSNGRSFSRNRKGSPGKSQRRARQREAANMRFQASIQAAADSSSKALEGLSDQIAEMLETLSAALGHEVTVEEAAEIAAAADRGEYEEPESSVVD